MVANNNNMNNNNNIMNNGAPPKIRYSGDLELKLSFDRDPMTRPSAGFRNPDAWFNSLRKSIPPPPKKSISDDETKRSKFASFFSSSKDSPSLPPPVHSVDNGKGNSGFGTLPTLHGYNDSKVRPAGARKPPNYYGEKFSKGGHGHGGENAYTHDEVVMEKSYWMQHRTWLYLSLFLSSLVSFAIMASLLNRYAEQKNMQGTVANAVNFFIFTGVATWLLSTFCLGWYYITTPSLPSFMHSFTISENKWLSLSEFLGHFVLAFFWFCTLVDLGLRTSHCMAEGALVGQQGVCHTVNTSIAFGAISMALVVLGFAARFRELYRIGALRRYMFWRRY
ncbi:hypothetical protein HK102_007626 [Quaeritorhiza haematococci]|nr:hypothetical protein HK102_007626 [Quaeritorhiza haematococci]